MQPAIKSRNRREEISGDFTECGGRQRRKRLEAANGPYWAGAFRGLALLVSRAVAVGQRAVRICARIDLAASSTVHDGFDLPAVGRLDDRLLWLRLPAPRSPRVHAR